MIKYPCGISDVFQYGIEECIMKKMELALAIISTLSLITLDETFFTHPLVLWLYASKLFLAFSCSIV